MGDRGQDYGAGEVHGVERIHQKRVGRAYHPVSCADGPDGLRVVLAALAPRILLRARDGAKSCVEGCALFVVGFETLAAVRAECVLVQGVDVNWSTNLVDCAEVCGGVSAQRLPEGGDRTVSQIPAGGREDGVYG